MLTVTSHRIKYPCMCRWIWFCLSFPRGKTWTRDRTLVYSKRRLRVQSAAWEHVGSIKCSAKITAKCFGPFSQLFDPPPSASGSGTNSNPTDTQRRFIFWILGHTFMREEEALARANWSESVFTVSDGHRLELMLCVISFHQWDQIKFTEPKWCVLCRCL